MQKAINRILDDFKKEQTKEGRIKVLRDNYSPLLHRVLVLTYEPRIKFLFSKAPEYKKTNETEGMGYNNLGVVLSKIYLFIENHPNRNRDVPLERTKQLLIQTFESLDRPEAEVLDGILQKDLNVPYLTVKLIDAAFPDIFNEDKVRLLKI